MQHMIGRDLNQFNKSETSPLILMQLQITNMYAIENAPSIFDTQISCDTDHGSPRGMPHTLQYI